MRTLVMLVLSCCPLGCELGQTAAPAAAQHADGWSEHSLTPEQRSHQQALLASVIHTGRLFKLGPEAEFSDLLSLADATWEVDVTSELATHFRLRQHELDKVDGSICYAFTFGNGDKEGDGPVLVFVRDEELVFVEFNALEY